jgi:Cd2+/Zn2+-exporting ATPase
MDCAAEVEALKATVGRLKDVERLDFNLLTATMTVTAAETVTDEALRDAARRAGLEIAPAEPHAPSEAPGFRDRYGRLAGVAASAAALAVGVTLHAVDAGSLLVPLAGEGAGEVALPPAVILAYVAALVLGGWKVIPKAVAAMVSLRPDMNLLMTIAVLGAAAIGQWFEAASVAVLFALALLMESWSVDRARHAIHALTTLAPARARYLCPHDGDIMDAPVENVPVGAIVLVRPGERIPLDGVLTEGSGTVNESPITGESRPIDKAPGDEVFAGSINNESALRFRADRPAADTTLARIIRMVGEAQSRRAPVEQWVDRFARVYTPLMIAAALVVAIAPPLVMGHWHAWFHEALVLLVIACPCALVISTPVAIIAGLTAAARQGVLIKGGVHLEAAARVQAIALDKTGTLTHGHPQVQQVVPFEGHTPGDVMAAAAALESMSAHPLARAICHHAAAAGLAIPASAELRAITGRGAEGLVNGKRYWIGSHRLMEERGAETPAIHAEAERLEDAGHSVVAVGTADHVCGLISIVDTLREQAPGALRELRNRGIRRVVMLTGDNAGTAAAVARAAGIDGYLAELLPEDKLKAVHDLAREFQHVAMVGDGVNDAPAMAAASLGIAMGAAGSDAAIETADIALMTDDLSRLPWLIGHARRVLTTIQVNIAFALGLKVIVMALALTGHATLWMAIAADMGASLVVVFWSLRLLRG